MGLERQIKALRLTEREAEEVRRSYAMQMSLTESQRAQIANIALESIRKARRVINYGL